jgi:uncharacterized protein YciU (UPF0263 family)
MNNKVRIFEKKTEMKKILIISFKILTSFYVKKTDGYEEQIGMDSDGSFYCASVWGLVNCDLHEILCMPGMFFELLLLSV